MADSFGNVTGQVVIGAGTPPAPATDPNVGYPFVSPGDIQWRQLPWLEGFQFTAYGVNLTGARLRLSIKGHEPWVHWCELQPPPSDGSPTCVSTGNGLFDTNNNYCIILPAGSSIPIQFDCGKAMLCQGGTCICDATGCVAYMDAITDQNNPWYFQGPGSPPTVMFDMSIVNGIASGSVSGAFSDSNVHFTKDP